MANTHMEDDIPCIECEEATSTGVCNRCQDPLCDSCFEKLHRKGNRKQHKLVDTVQQTSLSTLSSFPKDAVVLKDTIGKGGEAVVREGELFGTEVAVRIPSFAKGQNCYTEEQMESIKAEIETMNNVRHEGIARFLGYEVSALKQNINNFIKKFHQNLF